MLNGPDPILIFQIYKKLPPIGTTVATIPITSGTNKKATFSIIPIYLSESITGLYIDGESKNIDIDTDQNSLTNGDPAFVNQKALASITTVNIKARSGSVGLTILLALAELILDKVTSQEYEITYMHGAVTVFGGLIHGFSYEQGANDDLYRIKLEISKGRKKPASPVVPSDPTAERLATSGPIPSSGASTVTTPTSGGSPVSVIQPGLR